MPTRFRSRILSQLRPWNIVDQYVFTEVFPAFFGGCFFFMFVFLMFQIVRLVDYFINHGVGLILLLRILTYISAAFLPVVLPISFLVAVLAAFGRMSADSEIVAFKASGFSLKRLYGPVFLLSLLVGGAVYYLTAYYIPWGNRELKRTLVKLGNTKVVSNIKEGTFTEGFFDLLVYADKVNPETNEMDGVFIFDEREPKNPMVILARRGEVIPLKTESELSLAAVLKLSQGSIHRSDLARNYYEKIDFGEYRVSLKIPEGHADEMRYAKTLGDKDIRRMMAENIDHYDRYQEYAIEFWKRIGLALAVVCFGFLGSGIGVVRVRSVKSSAVLIAFAVVLLYWGLHVLGASFAEGAFSHSVSARSLWVMLVPAICMQLPNLAVLAIGWVGFRRASY